MFKKDIVAKKLHSGSKQAPQVIKHAGKGSQVQPLKSQGNFDGAVGGDYGKVNSTTDNAAPGLGNGDWTGNLG